MIMSISGSWVFAKSTMSESITGEYFSVQVKNEYRGRGRHVSYTRDVYVKFGDVEIKLEKRKRIFVSICFVSFIVSILI